MFATFHRIGNNFETKYGEVWHYGESQTVNWQCELQRNSEEPVLVPVLFIPQFSSPILTAPGMFLLPTLFSENCQYK